MQLYFGDDCSGRILFAHGKKIKQINIIMQVERLRRKIYFFVAQEHLQLQGRIITLIYGTLSLVSPKRDMGVMIIMRAF